MEEHSWPWHSGPLAVVCGRSPPPQPGWGHCLAVCDTWEHERGNLQGSRQSGLRVIEVVMAKTEPPEAKHS